MQYFPRFDITGFFLSSHICCQVSSEHNTVKLCLQQDTFHASSLVFCGADHSTVLLNSHGPCLNCVLLLVVNLVGPDRTTHLGL